jgi:hypothetical protein
MRGPGPKHREMGIVFHDQQSARKYKSKPQHIAKD